MSTIKEDIKSQFKCGLSVSTDDDHFLIEPILLLCGHSVCFGCLEDFKKNQTEIEIFTISCIYYKLSIWSKEIQLNQKVKRKKEIYLNTKYI
jgi:hypothetical protein